jgi:hypothetical protein
MFPTALMLYSARPLSSTCCTLPACRPFASVDGTARLSRAAAPACRAALSALLVISSATQHFLFKRSTIEYYNRAFRERERTGEERLKNLDRPSARTRDDHLSPGL